MEFYNNLELKSSKYKFFGYHVVSITKLVCYFTLISLTGQILVSINQYKYIFLILVFIITSLIALYGLHKRMPENLIPFLATLVSSFYNCVTYKLFNETLYFSFFVLLILRITIFCTFVKGDVHWSNGTVHLKISSNILFLFSIPHFYYFAFFACTAVMAILNASMRYLHPLYLQWILE